MIIVILTMSLRNPQKGFSLSHLHTKCIREQLEERPETLCTLPSKWKTKVQCINILRGHTQGYNKSTQEQELDCVRLLTLKPHSCTGADIHTICHTHTVTLICQHFLQCTLEHFNTCIISESPKHWALTLSGLNSSSVSACQDQSIMTSKTQFWFSLECVHVHVRVRVCEPAFCFAAFI